MRGEAGRADEDLRAARQSVSNVALEQIGRSMRGYHAKLVWHAQLGQRVGRLLNDLEVRSAANDDGDEWLHRNSYPPVGAAQAERCEVSVELVTARPLVVKL